MVITVTDWQSKIKVCFKIHCHDSAKHIWSKTDSGKIFMLSKNMIIVLIVSKNMIILQKIRDGKAWGEKKKKTRNIWRNFPVFLFCFSQGEDTTSFTRTLEKRKFHLQASQMVPIYPPKSPFSDWDFFFLIANV